MPGTAVAAPDTSYFVVGKDPGTYYYRVAAYNAAGRPSRWSNVESVTVTQISSADSAVGKTAASDEQIVLTATPMITVEVSTDNGGTWHPVSSLEEDPSGWWNWSYDWILPEGDGVQYPLKARTRYAAGGTYGEDTITVTLRNAGAVIYLPLIFRRWPPIPYAPTMNDITFIGTGYDYRVSWDYNGDTGVPDPTEYQLQEATDLSFTQDVTNYTVPATDTPHKDFTDKSGGTYYYRVRGKNAYGYGEWSGVKSVTLGFVYNFTNSTEGWAITRSDEGEGWDLPAPISKDGQLYHLVYGKADYSILSPRDTAPAVPYTISGRVDIVNSEYIGGREHPYAAKSGMTYGIIFGGNNASPCPADRNAPDGCLSRYYRVLASWDQARGQFKWSLKRIDYTDAEHGAGRGVDLIGWRYITGFEYDSLGWNEWRIEVTDDASDNIKVYMNGHLLGSATDHTYLDEPYFGVFLSSLRELGAVATKWDWFKVQ